MVMASIYATCDMYHEALAEIDYLLSLEGNFTVNDFNLGTRFDPLLGSKLDSLKAMPEFQKLMKRYALPPGT